MCYKFVCRYEEKGVCNKDKKKCDRKSKSWYYTCHAYGKDGFNFDCRKACKRYDYCTET